jgi:hypothetical protein
LDFEALRSARNFERQAVKMRETTTKAIMTGMLMGWEAVEIQDNPLETRDVQVGLGVQVGVGIVAQVVVGEDSASRILGIARLLTVVGLAIVVSSAIIPEVSAGRLVTTATGEAVMKGGNAQRKTMSVARHRGVLRAMSRKR